jgi:mono/diheme cytochrome c family protein
MKRIPLSFGAVVALAAGASFATETRPDATTGSSAAMIERGRYLAIIGGCNDCHTRGYAERQGRVPESDWLTGDSLGWQGPWGTTYPPNLRRLMNNLGEEEWLVYVKTAEPRPPMPWYQLRAMTDEDLRALHRFIRTLGPAGAPAPAYLPPGDKAAGPVVVFPGVEPSPLTQR